MKLSDVEIESILKPSADRSEKFLRVRCPECLKLYAINSGEIHEARPKFACVQCSQKFWIAFPEALEATDAIMGFPLAWDQRAQQPETLIEPVLEQKPFSCPKCTEPYAGGATECKKCGIVFQKFFEKEIGTVSAPREVRLAWSEVLDHYDNFATHQKFISVAQAFEAFEFAFQQYQRILAANPADTLAANALQSLSQLSVTIAESSEPRSWSQRFQWPAVSATKLVNFLFLLCGLVIALGFVVPESRNLVGFGSAILFALLALRFYFRAL